MDVKFYAAWGEPGYVRRVETKIRCMQNKGFVEESLFGLLKRPFNKQKASVSGGLSLSLVFH